MNRAAELLNAAQAVLLDFDGPVTPLMPAPANSQAADAARAPLLARRVTLDRDIATTSDHLAVLRWAATNAPDVLLEVEKQCDDAETASALTAEPTRGAAELLAACYEVHKPVVIVSNNTARAIHAFLEHRSLTSYVTSIVGRPVGRPDLMKPHAHIVDDALKRLRAEAGHAVFIGDSVSDVEVSLNTGVPCIGYGKTPSRAIALSDAGATAVIADMRTLTEPV